MKMMMEVMMIVMMMMMVTASSHFFPIPNGSVVSPPAFSSPPCREEPRFAVRQVARTQYLTALLRETPQVRQVKIEMTDEIVGEDL